MRVLSVPVPRSQRHKRDAARVRHSIPLDGYVVPLVLEFLDEVVFGVSN